MVGSTQNNHVGYRRVTEKMGANGENGKIVSYFTSPYEYTDVMDFFKPFAPPTSNGYKTGLLLKEEIFSTTAAKVQEKVITYQFLDKNIKSIKLTYGRIAPPMFSGGWNDLLLGSAYAIYPYYDKFSHNYYDLRMGVARVQQVSNKFYDASGNYVEKLENFEYDANLRNIVKNKAINSTGVEHISKYKYPQDYTLTTVSDNASKAIKKMVELNIISPIETMNYIKEPNQTEKLISANINIYQNLTVKNVPLLKEVWNTEFNTPQTGFVSSSIDATGTFIKSNLYKTQGDASLPANVINTYDDRGNVLDYYTQNQNKNSIIWSKNPDLALASTQNAAKNEIAYHGFDGFEIADYGWANIPSSATLSSTAKIGKSASISNATYPMVTLVPDGQNKTYMMSVWVQALSNTSGKLVLRVSKISSGAEVTKITQNFTGVNINTWAKQMLQVNLKKIRTDFSIPASETLKIEAYVEWVSGSFKIDEFRIHPIDAYMTSYVYDAKLNLIATSNEREEITSYFYDNFNRLQYVKDFENNVRSFNEYHYSTGGSDQNYVKTSTILVPGKTTLPLAQAATQSERQDVVNYFDGLGRAIQTNQVNAGPAGHDIVSFTEYDSLGRVAKNYLPVPLPMNIATPGAYRSTIKTEQAAKYSEAGYIEGVELTTFAFSENKFDNSPLNQVVEKGYAGADWQIIRANNTPGKTRKIVYRANTATDAVRNFSGTGNFGAGDLFVEEMTNTDGEKSAVFKDKLGRVILMRQYGKLATDNKNTYIIYNLLGQVIYVIPQIGVKWMTDNNNWDPTNAALNQLIYKYTYDTRGRALTKKVPNKAEEKYFYDKRDRLVLSKNGRISGTFKEYIFIKYDNQNRIIQSGLYYASVDPTQSAINAKQLNETNVANGYTNVAFPDVTITGNKVLTINFYDHYDTDLNNTADFTYISDADIIETVDATFSNTRGLQTVIKTAVLNNPKTDDAPWLSAVTFYNKYARPIQIQKTNLFASGSDVEKNQYNNFRGLLMKHKTTHKGVDPLNPLNVLETYGYTKSGLLTRTKQKVNIQTEIVLSNNKYNKLGTLITKQIDSTKIVNYLQDIDYKYNIRGWLTDINNVGDNCGKNGSVTCSKDVFALKLFYNTIDNEFVNADNTPLYDGGISAVRWKTAGMSVKDTVMYGYNYIYDEFNQLKDANFMMTNRKKDPANLYTWLNDFEIGKYDEHIRYDAMGNIDSLTRTGKKLTGTTLSNIVFDKLKYTYKGNQLVTVNDVMQGIASQTGNGFIDGVKLASNSSNTTNDEYIYDARGNVITDKNKNISTIVYNHLDLPQSITFSGGKVIEFVYTADGQKLRKIQKTNSTINAITEYAGEAEYSGTLYTNLAFTGFRHAEGKLIYDGTKFVNQYAIKDHLGNVRVRIQDKKDVNGNYDGILDKTKEVLEETHYYPFGMAFTSNTNPSTPVVDNFKYNNKELNPDFGLNWYDYQARQYDPAIGRWNSIDPMADKYANWSPYNYVFNNPVSFIDPDGMDPELMPGDPTLKSITYDKKNKQYTINESKTTESWEYKQVRNKDKSVTEMLTYTQTETSSTTVLGEDGSVVHAVTSTDKVTKEYERAYDENADNSAVDPLQKGFKLMYSQETGSTSNSLGFYGEIAAKGLSESGVFAFASDQEIAVNERRQAMELTDKAVGKDFETGGDGYFNLAQEIRNYDISSSGKTYRQNSNTTKPIFSDPKMQEHLGQSAVDAKIKIPPIKIPRFKL